MKTHVRLFVCTSGHVLTDCDTHDVCETVDSVDFPPIYQAYLERSCVDCGELVNEVHACTDCGAAPAEHGSDRCRSCDVQLAAEEAAEVRRAKLRFTLASIALTQFRGAA